MTSALVSFTFNDIKLFTITINDKPWTRAKEVCRSLSYARNTPNVISDHVSPENRAYKYQLVNLTATGKSVKWPIDSRKDEYYINEEGMYELAFTSQQKEAKDFRKYCCNTLFPKIRQKLVDIDLESSNRRHQLAIEDKDMNHRVAIQRKDSHIALITHNHDIANGIIRARDIEIENLMRNRHVPLSGKGYDEVFIIVKKNSDYDELYPLYLICRQKRGTRQALLKLRTRYPHLDILTQFDTPNSIHRWNEIKQRNPAVIQWSDRHFRILNPDIELEMFALTDDGVVG